MRRISFSRASFGAADVALIDMIHRIDPKTALFYLDTDFLFPETHDVKQHLIERYRLRPHQLLEIKSLLTPEEQATQYGEALWARDPARFCWLPIRDFYWLHRWWKTL